MNAAGSTLLGSPGPRYQQGRMLEPLIMVATVAVLAAIAIPAYLDYRTRSRVAEGLALAESARLAVERSFEKSGPADMSRRENSGWSPPAPTGDVQSITVSPNGTISIVYAGAVAEAGSNQLQIVPVSGGKLFDLSAAANKAGAFEWQCGGAAGKSTLAERFRPARCRGQGSGDGRWGIVPLVVLVMLFAVAGLLFLAWLVVMVGSALSLFEGPLGRFRDELLATLAHPGALALGITLVYPIGLVFHGAFTDPGVYRVFHDAERARVRVTELQKVRRFPASWLATVNWVDASRQPRSAQIRIGASSWWDTDSPELSVGQPTDILVSRSQPGATAWRKDPPRVVPRRFLGVEFNPEALAIAFGFLFVGLVAMMGVRAVSEQAGKQQR